MFSNTTVDFTKSVSPKSLASLSAVPPNFISTFEASSFIVTTSPDFKFLTIFLAESNSTIFPLLVSYETPLIYILVSSAAILDEFSFEASSTVPTVILFISGNVWISSLYADLTSFPSTTATNLNAYVSNEFNPSIVILFSLFTVTFLVVFNVYFGLS